MDPQNPDGWTNVGRVRVQEGNTDGAKEVLLKALALKPGLARANFFYGRVLKEEGKYDEAAKVLQEVLAQFPRDRVVRNELGRVLFLAEALYRGGDRIPENAGDRSGRLAGELQLDAVLHRAWR